MSRPAGQITRPQALGGTLLVVLAASAIVAGATALLRPEVAGVRPEPRPAPSTCTPPAAGPGTGPVAVTSAELIACPRAFEGVHVVYEGEVVRAVLRRGDRAWAQLNDDPYAGDLGPLPGHLVPAGVNTGVPVRLPGAAADRITVVGDARHKGDRLRVEGTFHRAHPADAGGPAIEAETAVVVARGGPVPRSVGPARIAAAVLLSAAAIVLTLLAGAARRR